MKNFDFKKQKFQFLLLFALLCSISFLGSSAIAQPYLPDDQITILSTSSGTTDRSNELNLDQLVEWIVVPEQIQEDGSRTLAFYWSDTMRLICRVSLNDISPGIKWENTSRIPQAFSGSNFLIIPGVNVPCDILPVDKSLDRADALVFDIRREVGGQSFLDKIQVETFNVSWQEAIENGWLIDNISGDQSQSKLFLIRAINLRTNALLTKQLWSEGDSWWLYEETPTRQSWRLTE